MCSMRLVWPRPRSERMTSYDIGMRYRQHMGRLFCLHSVVGHVDAFVDTAYIISTLPPFLVAK